MGHRAPGLSVVSCKQGCPPRHLRQRLQSWLAYAHLEHESWGHVQASSPSAALHGTIHSCWEGLHHHSRKRALRIGDESAGPMAVWEKPLEGRGCVRVSCAKLPCPVLFQRTVPYTSMGEEHREAADRQKTDSTGQTDNREEKTGPGPLPSYGGCFTGCCLPWLLGSTHHLGGLCWLQHKTPARDQIQSRTSPQHTTGGQRASGRATGIGPAGLEMCLTESRSIQQDRQVERKCWLTQGGR